MTSLFAARAALSGLALFACDDARPPLPPLEPASSAAVVLPQGPSVHTYVVERSSRASVVMVAPRETFRGMATLASGRISLDVAKLSASRAEVKVDLATLASESFREPSKNAMQSEHARAWLEVPRLDLSVAADSGLAANRFADFRVRALPKVSAENLADVRAETANGESVRVVQMTAKGELAIHGGRVERDILLEVIAHYASQASVDPPTWLEVRTLESMRVVLAEHEIKPRDASGKLAKAASHLLGTRVADEAEINLELRARRQP